MNGPNLQFGSIFTRTATLALTLSLLSACGGGSSSQTNTSQNLNQQAEVLANPSPSVAKPDPEPFPVPVPIQVEPKSNNSLQSADIVIDWQPPTSRIDGSAINMSEIDSYVIFIRNKSKTFFKILEIDGTSSAVNLEDFVPDDYIVLISVIDSLNTWSEWSNTYQIKKSSFSG